ncbi:hypothetical protein C5E18_11950 [Pectobacterium parmentieri]|nr:hypothetical protein C5E18_11950 [Pectobacterium parmentieri]
MQRIKIEGSTALISSSTTPMMLSINGDACRLYMGEMPADETAGHLVSGGYQIIIPAGLSVYASAVSGTAYAVVGPFGV